MEGGGRRVGGRVNERRVGRRVNARRVGGRVNPRLEAGGHKGRLRGLESGGEEVAALKAGRATAIRSPWRERP